MNVAMLCKVIPAHQPHELLGFLPDSLKGTLLSIELVSKINRLEAEASKKSNQESSSRMSKFKQNK